MSKYIDLIGQITERLDVPCGNIRLGIHEALAYLDRNPDQVPDGQSRHPSLMKPWSRVSRKTQLSRRTSSLNVLVLCESLTRSRRMRSCWRMN